MNKFGFALTEELNNIIEGRMESNEKIVNKFFKDPEFKTLVTEYMIKKVYQEITEGSE